MSYAIIGFGKIGHALAKAFARKGIEVSVATKRDPKSFPSDAAATGPKVIAKTLAGAVKADVIFLAVRFDAHPDVAKTLPTWHGKTIVDVTNAYGVPPEELGGQPSSKFVAQAFTGAKLVKGFNHLVAAVLDQDPAVHGGKRVVFLASDDDSAADQIGALAENLGFSPIKLGGLFRRRAACAGPRKQLGPADLQGLGQVRRMNATSPPGGTQRSDRIAHDPRKMEKMP
jgi:8-hydroxy-5-deazaflavin:NADPH oxidoreductase